MNINPIEQTQKLPTLSNNYGFVSTEALLDVFKSKGWVIDSVYVNKVRLIEKDGFQKHMIRMIHPDFPAIPGLTENNKSRPQLVLLNSHDGSSALRVFTGLIRLACMNGIITGKSVLDFKAIHSKNITEKLGAGIESLVDSFPEMYSQLLRLQNTTFSADQLNKLVDFACELRLGKNKDITEIYRETVCSPLRNEDTEADAFTILNRIQEKLIRGGITYSQVVRQHNQFGTVIAQYGRIRKTPAIRSIPTQLNINRALYDKAMELVGIH